MQRKMVYFLIGGYSKINGWKTFYLFLKIFIKNDFVFKMSCRLFSHWGDGNSKRVIQTAITALRRKHLAYNKTVWLIFKTYSLEFDSRLLLRRSCIVILLASSHFLTSFWKAAFFSSKSFSCCSNDFLICSSLFVN